MANFFSSYETAMEEKPNNKQAALSSIESKYTNSFAGKTNYVDINGLFARLVDKVEVNERYMLNNGYLTRLHDEIDVTSYVTNMTEFRDYLQLSDTPFAFVQLPHVVPSDDDEMIPLGFETYANRNADRLLDGLKENNVNFLDFRTIIGTEGIDHYNLFYKTDHHWKVETAFWAHEEIVHYINSLVEIDVQEQYFDLSNYNVEKVTNIFLGSHGARTGVLYSGLDDNVLITPNFETNSKYTNGNNSSKSGDFQNSYVRADYFSNGLTTVYTPYSVTADLANLFNYEAHNELKIMILKDSYCNALLPFLSLHFQEICVVDLRATAINDFMEQLHEHEPDIVLQLNNLEQISLQSSQFVYLSNTEKKLLNT